MAHEVNMSVTRYYEIKDRLVPKHRSGNDSERRRDILRKQMR
jgi:hypothetical protein